MLLHNLHIDTSLHFNFRNRFMVFGLNKGYIFLNMNISIYVLKKLTYFFFKTLYKRQYPIIHNFNNEFLLNYGNLKYLFMEGRWRNGLLSNYKNGKSFVTEVWKKKKGFFLPSLVISLYTNQYNWAVKEARSLRIPSLFFVDIRQNVNISTYPVIGSLNSNFSRLFLNSFILNILHKGIKKEFFYIFKFLFFR